MLVLLRRRKAREMQSGGGRPNKARTRMRVAAIYDGVVKQLAKAGARREAHTTPRELADRYAAKAGPGAAAFAELTDLYYAALWGGHSDPRAEARADELASVIKAALKTAESTKAA